MATTPPPPSELRIPPTPRHGPGYDAYEPYAPRHSARLASQRCSRNTRSTPPPGFPNAQVQPGLKSARKQRNAEVETLSPPGSIHGTPRKNQLGRLRGFARTHSLDNTFDSNNNSDTLDPEPPLPKQPSLQAFPSTLTNGMLPTPAKTPKKKAVGDVSTTARTLFPPSSMSGRGKKGKKVSAFSLESFSDDPSVVQSQIEIYTDSRDRIPELHDTEENLFYRKPADVETTRKPTTRPSRTRKVEEGKRDKGIYEALKRDDGMVYVFRGRKIFRRFQDDVHNGEDDDDDRDDLGLLAARPDLMEPSVTTNVRPLTRSSIKPRVLFPSAGSRSAQRNHASDADEEAATDIEEHMFLQDSADEDTHSEEVETPERPVTPPIKSTVTTPASPGATTRSLRPRTKRGGVGHDGTPTASESNKKHSPFDGWLRKKQTPTGAISKSRKRDAATIGSPGGPAMKRSRGSRTTAASTST